MRQLSLSITLILFLQLQTTMAGNLTVVQLASASANPATGAKTDTQIIYEMLVKMFDRWNARDIDGLMSVYWHSPSLLAVIDTEQFDGWENLCRSYQVQSRNPVNMGVVNPTRVQVQLLEPDLAFGIVSWTMRFPENAHASEIVGMTTVDMEKFGSDWKIVALHTSFSEM